VAIQLSLRGKMDVGMNVVDVVTEMISSSGPQGQIMNVSST
jgi:hypothetical protein